MTKHQDIQITNDIMEATRLTQETQTAKNYYVNSGLDLRSTSGSIIDKISMRGFLGNSPFNGESTFFATMESFLERLQTSNQPQNCYNLIV